METAFIALGSNLGDRLKNLEKGRAALDLDPKIEFLGQSSIFETAAMYRTDQPDFLNQVVWVSTVYDPLSLLKRLKAVEQKCGRELRDERNMPRLLDLDILTYGEYIIETDDLVIPHPKLHERRFVLEPWCELSPDYHIPGYEKTVKELLRKTSDKSRIVITNL